LARRAGSSSPRGTSRICQNDERNSESSVKL
jgi:hypothetical protein